MQTQHPVAQTPVDSSTKKPQKKHSSVAVPKRMSVAYLQPLAAYQHPVHPAAAGYQIYASQQQLMGARQSYQQQMMWHARSMESGLGKYINIYFCNVDKCKKNIIVFFF